MVEKKAFLFYFSALKTPKGSKRMKNKEENAVFC